jgi:hypothetical protein
MKMRTTKYTKLERELSQLAAAASAGKRLIENFTAQVAFGSAAAWDKPRSVVYAPAVTVSPSPISGF